MVHWKPYLESLCKTYAQWWRVYTLTDVVGRKREEAEPLPLLFNLRLMEQTVERQKEESRKEEEKIERLTVLEGLRKYASEHVLLVGRPGSGKSTALIRLVLEEAEKARTPLSPPLVRGEEDSSTDSQVKGEASRSTPLNSLLVRGEEKPSLAPPLIRGAGGVKIPVLVELRYYRTSILDLIQDFLQRHDPNLPVDAEMLKTLLRQGQLLLLVDGLNELPSEEARRDLHKFRQDYQKTTPMIFTTRDLGVGGDLDIAKSLEMQPLSEAQMQQFVRAYLPQQGEEMLRQLGNRLREFGQTPLLLMMLCSVFVDNRNRVPSNLGSVFRRFTQIYSNKLKQDIPISQESRRWWHRLLEQLAWVMTCGEAKTQLQVAIPRQQAEAVLTEFLRGKVAHPEDCTLACLEDLLKHHLIQLRAGDQIEFRHQLIQEYYTAEWLLKLLPSLGDEELKREYLNYLKWTEPLALMLELVEDEEQVVRVVKLALKVDLRLGARLAGAVKPKWQKQTTGLVAGLAIPQLLKNRLLGITRSNYGISTLVLAFDHDNSSICESAVYALVSIASEESVNALSAALNHKNYSVRNSAIYALENIGSDAAVDALKSALNYKNSSVGQNAAYALERITSGQRIAPPIILAVNDKNYRISDFYKDSLWLAANHNNHFQFISLPIFTGWKTIGALEEIGVPEILPYLSELLLTTGASYLLNVIAAIQNRCQFYNYTLTQAILTPQPQPNLPRIRPLPTVVMHILHLSDLHFGTLDQANLWSNQLAADLYNDLSIPHLDALILSGDIANYSTQEEYEAAQQFLHNLRQDFPLNPEQIILVPGNHDLNWKVTNWEMADDVAYTLKLRRQCKAHELQEGYYIQESTNAVWVRDEEKYKQRFAHFSQFYETIKQKPYPLDYDEQYTLDHLPEQNLLILGLNSAWQLDHHYKSRASINMGALTNALTQIRRNPDYKNCLKIAVWHHPLDSAYSDRITDQGFLEQLAVNGFRFFLHGHIHKAETSLFRYDMSTNGRKLDRICAGTFGAPIREWVPGYPLQYNLLKIEDNQLTVYTRRREELNGAWKPDARWLQGAGKTPLDYYAIAL